MMFMPQRLSMASFAVAAIIGVLAGSSTADNRLQAPRLEGATGAGGYTGVSGIGERRSLPNQYSFRYNGSEGRRFEHSFDMTTNAQFRRHNIDNVGERLRTESLYNNPWYWQNVGSLDTELMTGGSGIPLASYESDGNYYNPYFYDQWRTSDGQQHSGSMTSEIGLASRFAPEVHDTRGDRRDGPALLPGTNAPSIPNTPDGNRVGLLAADRTVLAGDRLGTTLRSDIDSSWSGRSLRMLGTGYSPSGLIRYQGSSIRGLASMPMQSATDTGLTNYDVARLRDDRMSGRMVPSVGAPWETRFKDLSTSSNRIQAEGDGSPPPMPTPLDLTETYQAMADRYASLHPSAMSLEERLDALDRDYRRFRGELIVGEMFDKDAPLVPASPPEGEGLEYPKSDEPEAPGDDEEVEDIKPVDQPPSLLSWNDYGLVLKHGQRIESMSSGDGSRFDDLMEAAAQRLADGDYLRAERRFNRALRFVRGHPLATAGMGHAQLGAGLYLSSALTLQSLLAFQPEMIDVQYASSLLPGQDELDRAISDLTRRIQGNADLDRYGFLLAYLGHQLDRPGLVEDGLNAMQQGGADDRFVQLLREIWTSQTTPVSP